MKKFIIYSSFLFAYFSAAAQPLTAYFENTAQESVDIQVLLPAEKSYDTAVQTILIEPGPFLKPFIEISVKDKIYQIELSDVDLARLCTDALADRIADGPRFAVKTGGTIHHHIISTGLDWDDVDSTCVKELVDGIILLEKMEMSIHSDVQKTKVYPVEGGSYFTYTATSQVVIHVSWKFYNPLGRQEVEKDTSIIEDISTDEFDYPDDALANLPGFDDLLKDYASLAGDISAVAFSPVWVTEQRNYYLNGNSDMHSVKQLINEEKWDEAFRIWRKYTDSKNNALSKHASYNTILSYEIEGDLESALKWANKTYDKFQLESAQVYAEWLTDRIREKAIIEKQLGITK